MPGLLQRSAQFGNAPAPDFPPPTSAGSLSSNAIWSKHREDITFEQLQKFWSELSLQARQELLRIDKQTLFEQARKNLYCSRCNGLLLEGFLQIVMYGKSLQQEGAGVYLHSIAGVASKNNIDNETEDIQDPSVHPWGGLATTRDGILTLLDCFINAKSLKALQNVFDSARVRERERELLYPDACGGGGRGWISQGMANYGRGHGTRETCALHTARLSCDTLVDFWSALGEETRTSLLQMKEEDFIERLMFRFDSKKFCKDCRRNVIREFKELKELKRMRRELRCTSWFCVADTAFQYEVSKNTVQADWHQSFTDTVGMYHHFEWAIGTGEGKFDILDFEDVGMNGKVEMNGLNLGGLSECFITLRAWKLDGRYTELSVKAHALKGQPCVHRRLVVGDGFITITKGESIRRFFEHAEEAEEEEDDDSVDRDGNELDGDGSHPQKHAKSPELAREFLLDAAIVIFKEQVEKAFREGTARQNAHSLFVSLALKLLEERVHVACKEIITLEKQIKLLEEEEKEKREEEERRERRRTKEREKKLRRKERLQGKERERERKHIESKSLHCALPNDSSTSTHDESSTNALDSGDSISDPGDTTSPPRLISPDIKDEQSTNGCVNTKNLKTDCLQHQCHVDGSVRDGSGSFILEQSKSSRRKLRFKKDSLRVQHDESDMKLMASSRCMNGGHRPLRERVVKTNARNCNLKFSENFYCSNSRLRDRYDFQSRSSNQHGDYRPKDGYHISTIRSAREIKTANRTESTLDMPRPLYRSSKYNHGCYIPDTYVLPKGKLASGNPDRDVLHTKQVWEPTDARRKCTRSNSDPDVTMSTSITADQSDKIEFDKAGNGCQQPDDHTSEFSENLGKTNALGSYDSHEDGRKSSNKSDSTTPSVCQNGFVPVTKSDYYSKDGAMSTFPTSSSCDPILGSSCSDNCSSCLSEGDSSTSSSSAQNVESSSTSDSEDASQQSEGIDTTSCNGNAFHSLPYDTSDSKTKGGSSFTRTITGFPLAGCLGANLSKEETIKTVHNCDSGGIGFDVGPPKQKHMLPTHNHSMHMPVFPSPTMGYHTQNAVSWTAVPANGLVPFSQPNHYVFTPSPLGYRLPANRSSEFGMQNNNLHHMAAPVFNVHHHSVYQAANRVYVASSKDQIKNFSICGSQQANDVAEPANGSLHPLEGSFPNRQLPSKPSSAVGQNGIVGNGGKSHGDTQSFSLFHFGGPLAGAAGYNVNLVSPKKENAGRFVLKSPAPQADTACSEEETAVEEYSLFAAGNGARFSFF